MRTSMLPPPSTGVVICTSSPELFLPYAAALGGRSTVHIHTSHKTALTALAGLGETATQFFVDFKPLADNWSGARFLRHLRGSQDHEKFEIWLMADDWNANLSDWALRAGAAGMARRSHRGVRKVVSAGADQAPPSSVGLQDDLVRIEAIFRRFAGPLAALHTRAARTAIANGTLDASADAFAMRLAEGLSLPEMRSAFLHALLPWFWLSGTAQAQQLHNRGTGR